ncbi:MAG: TetR/AcrR family transcriptional regulator C-terminal domain-containing protein [Actinomycetota bacterium]
MAKPCRGGARSTAKREAILDAAQGVFLETGYAAASMDAVATRAGVSKATIYAHFETKDRLFAAVMQRRCEQSYAFAPPEDMGDARTALTLLGQRLIDLMLSPEALALYRVVVAEAARHPDLARAFYETGPGRGRANIVAVLEDLNRRGLLRVDDPSRVTDQFIGMLRSDAYTRALLGLPPGDGTDAAATLKAAVDTVLKVCGG